MPQPSDLLSRSISADDLPDSRTSLDLLALAQSGNHTALEDLIVRYQDRLRRIVRIQLGASILRRHYDSMDIVQSTFRAALPKVRELRPRSAAGLLQWLSLIATNQIRDAHDFQHAARRDLGRDVLLDTDRGTEPADSSASPGEQALLAEVRDLLDEEVSRLPGDQRRVIILRDYCGEDWERIATELHRDSGAARQLHQRAWIKLRQALRPKLDGTR